MLPEILSVFLTFAFGLLLVGAFLLLMNRIAGGR